MRASITALAAARSAPSGDSRRRHEDPSLVLSVRHWQGQSCLNWFESAGAMNLERTQMPKKPRAADFCKEIRSPGHQSRVFQFFVCLQLFGSGDWSDYALRGEGCKGCIVTRPQHVAESNCMPQAEKILPCLAVPASFTFILMVDLEAAFRQPSSCEHDVISLTGNGFGFAAASFPLLLLVAVQYAAGRHCGVKALARKEVNNFALLSRLLLLFSTIHVFPFRLLVVAYCNCGTFLATVAATAATFTTHQHCPLHGKLDINFDLQPVPFKFCVFFRMRDVEHQALPLLHLGTLQLQASVCGQQMLYMISFA